jgi:hypothetical protein
LHRWVTEVQDVGPDSGGWVIAVAVTVSAGALGFLHATKVPRKLARNECAPVETVFAQFTSGLVEKYV